MSRETIDTAFGLVACGMIFAGAWIAWGLGYALMIEGGWLLAGLIYARTRAR